LDGDTEAGLLHFAGGNEKPLGICGLTKYAETKENAPNAGAFNVQILKGLENMKIEVKIRKTFAEGPLKAIVSVTLDGCIAVHDMKIIERADESGPFVAMPSRKDENGYFRDICHPINEEFRKEITDAVLNAYEAENHDKNNTKS